MALKSYAHLQANPNKTKGSRKRNKPHGFWGEVTSAIGTGAQGFAQSIVDLPKVIPGIDYELDVPEFSDKPQTTLGNIASYGVQFAIPFAAVTRVGSLAAHALNIGTKVTTKVSGLTKAPTIRQALRSSAAHPLPIGINKPSISGKMDVLVKTKDIKKKDGTPDLRFKKKPPQYEKRDIGYQPEVLTRHEDLLLKSLLPGTVPKIPTAIPAISVTKIPLTKAQKRASLAAGIVATDFIAFRPTDENLGNYLRSLGEDKKIPVLNAIGEFLATDEADSDALNRFRHVLEGLGMGFGIPIILKGLSKGISVSSHAGAKAMPKTAKRMADMRDRTIKSLDYTIFKIADEAHPVKLLVEAAEKYAPDFMASSRKKLKNAYEQRRMLVDVDRKIRDIAIRGVYHTDLLGNERKLSKGLHEIERPLLELDEDAVTFFDKYMYYIQHKQHIAEKIISVNKKTGKTEVQHGKKGTQIHQEFVDEIEDTFQYLTPQVKKIFETAIDEYKEFNFAMLRLQELEGVITPKARRALSYATITDAKGKFIREEKRLWVPLLRQADNEAIERSLSTKGKDVRITDKIHRGRTDTSKLDDAALKKYNLAEATKLNPALANLELGYSAMIKDMEQQKALRVMADTFLALPENIRSKYAELSKKQLSSRAYSAEAIKSALGKEGVTASAMSDDQYFRIFSSNYQIGDNTLRVYREGVEELWDIKDPLLIESLTAMGPAMTKDLSRFAMRYGGKFKNFLTQMITTSPTFFMGTNFTRDTLSVSMLVKGFYPFISSYRGLYHQIFQYQLL